jgi:glycosyltransferase involved in cell wall biosynthesis
MSRNFKPVYGIEYFLKALPQVFGGIPEARVLLIGSGPLESQLRTLAQELSISDKVRFLGQVANHELPKYLNAADLYVSSSLSDGTSLSLLEAMACALPVVVTDVPAILEWIQDDVNGLVVPKQNPERLAVAIVSLLRDRQTAQAMGQRNLEIARRRADWDKNFELLERIYFQLKHTTSSHDSVAC